MKYLPIYRERDCEGRCKECGAKVLSPKNRELRPWIHHLPLCSYCNEPLNLKEAVNTCRVLQHLEKEKEGEALAHTVARYIKRVKEGVILAKATLFETTFW